MRQSRRFCVDLRSKRQLSILFLAKVLLPLPLASLGHFLRMKHSVFKRLSGGFASSQISRWFESCVGKLFADLLLSHHVQRLLRRTFETASYVIQLLAIVLIVRVQVLIWLERFLKALLSIPADNGHLASVARRFANTAVRRF